MDPDLETSSPQKSRKTTWSPWSRTQPTMTAERDLDAVLCSVRSLPLRYWRERMIFLGLKDTRFRGLTGGLFPAKTGTTHPLFSLRKLPEEVGFKVCPCSSKKPFGDKPFRYVEKGCVLLHTGNVMDRNSYLVESIRFNIPSSEAYDLHFLGEVPPECLKQGHLRETA